MNGNKKCHAEYSNTHPKGLAWNVPMFTWILVIKYKISILYSVDPNKPNKKDGPREDT